MSSITLTVGNDEVGQMNSPLSPKSVPCITTKTLEDHDCRVSKGGLKYHAVESQRDTVNKRKDSQFHHPMVSCIYMNEKRRSSNETFHVRFTSPIVTEVRTRPRTKRKKQAQTLLHTSRLFHVPKRISCIRATRTTDENSFSSIISFQRSFLCFKLYIWTGN